MICPSCSSELARQPKWRGSCSSCGARLVRLRPEQDSSGKLRTLDDAREILRQSRRKDHERELRRAKESGLPTSVTVLSMGAPSTCSVCQTSNGQRYSLSEAFVRAPLPHAGCTCRWHDGMTGVCGCTYLFDDAPPLSAAETREADRRMEEAFRLLLTTTPTEDEHCRLTALASTIDQWWSGPRPQALAKFLQRFGSGGLR